MQQKLWELHKEQWGDRTSADGKISLLWMVDELGEAIAIIKKKGDEAIMNDPMVRAHYVEECSDVMMYFLDMLQCYDISAEEFSEAFRKKWTRNMSRTWKENDQMYETEETPDRS